MKADQVIRQKYDRMLRDYKRSSLPELYENIDCEELMLEGPGGYKLYTMIYRPAVNGKWPVIVHRSCYPAQHIIFKLNGEELARRGFAYVFQYCRGQGYSEGEWEPNIYDREDGLNLLNWLDDQKWVDCIGVYGTSYAAYTGWILADAVPEKVKSMCLNHYGVNRYRSLYESGLFRHDIMTHWTMKNAGVPIQADYLDSCRYRPQIEVDEALWNCHLDWYRDWVSSTWKEDPLWNTGVWEQLRAIPGKMKIPVYIMEGWFDHHLQSAIDSFELLSDESAAHSWMDIGCWNHAFQPCADGTMTEHLHNSEVLNLLEWFELTLKKKELPNRQIRSYVINEDRWETLRNWPPDAETKKLFYLDCGSRKLLEENPKEASSIPYEYDPQNPVYSNSGEALLASAKLRGSHLQPEPDYRSDVKSFLSRPLGADCRILGKMELVLTVSTDCIDTAFTARIMENRKDGTTYNIRSSAATISHYLGKGEVYTPNRPQKIQIRFWDVDWKLSEGSRLRIDISSSDFPQYSIHGNTSDSWATQKESVKATQRIYSGKENVSALYIPIAK